MKEEKKYLNLDSNYKSKYYINDLSDHQSDIFYKKYCINNQNDYSIDTYKNLKSSQLVMNTPCLSLYRSKYYINDLSDHQNDIFYKKYYKYKSKYINKKNKLKFLNWFEKNNGFQNLKLTEGENGKETIANHDIKNGEIIVKVPFKIMITVDNGIGDDFINDLTKKLLETKEKNQFEEYINILPTNFNFMVYNWDNTSLDIIKNTSIYKHVEKSIENYNKRYTKYKNKYGLVSEKDYNWAYSCSVTRNFSIYRNNKKYNSFVPFADLLNHSNKNNSTWYFDKINDEFIMKANKNIKKDDKVTTSYGFVDGNKSLTWYGFFYDEYHTIDFINLDSNKKLEQLEKDYERYKHLKNDYPIPIKILKKEIELLKY